MALHALAGGGLPPDCEVTVTLIAPELLLPGFGLLTLTANVPALGADPVAVSCVAETNVVLIAAPPNDTCAPLTNLLPVSVSEDAPAVNVAGLTLLSTGVSFHSVTSLVPFALESAADVALMVIVFGFVRTAGAVYRPAFVISPRVAFPPTTPFTDQVTLWFVVPLTAAVNGCPAPARTFAAVGVTLTAICAGGVEPPPDFVVPVQLTCTRTSASTRPSEARRICSLQVFEVIAAMPASRC